MGSKLRPLYDALYMGIDTWVVAYQDNRSGRKRARKIPKHPDFDAQYRSRVLPYWKRFGVVPKKFWFRIYAQNRETVDPRFIPDDLWYRRIVPHFNHLLFAQAYQDKCLNNVFVPTIAHPPTVVKCVSGVLYDDALNLLTPDEAAARVMQTGRFIIKPSVGSGRGNGIRFLNGAELSRDDVLRLFREYGKNFLIQEKLRQHPAVAALHEQSLNTLRVITFLFENEVHILSAVLRVGAGDSELDNVSKGGFACKVLPDGQLDEYAVNRKAEWVRVHPDGTPFGQVRIPNYESLLQTVKDAASRLGHFRIIGWDIAIGEAGEPVYIEYNLIPGQNQKTWGPTFGDLTDRVLQEVFQKKGE